MGMEREQDLARQLYELHFSLVARHAEALKALQLASQALQHAQEQLQTVTTQILKVIADDLDERRPKS